MVRRNVSRYVSLAAAGLVAAVALVVPTSVGAAGAATIARPEGAGPPVAASGMGTQAALDNPRCRHDDPKYGPYGRFDTTEFGNGAPCVKAWNAGDDNGGATSQGVTRNKVTVVAVIPNDEQQKTDPVAPKQRAGGAPSTYQNSFYDYMLPQMRFYETWGRDIEVKFHESSGNDEAAQRADLVAVKAMKPFAAIVYAQPPSGTPPLTVLEAGLAQAKILTMGYAATAREAAAQEPYRWNASDSQAGAINSAEVMGKQLVGKKAQYGGDDVKNQTRKFAVVYDPKATDYTVFTSTLAKLKGKVTIPIQFSATTATSEVATQLATAVTKMKAAGVTTVVNFSAPFTELMNAADRQEWTPEWFYSGTGFADLAILARGYPVTQAKHGFGLSAIPAVVEAEEVAPPAVSYRTQVDPLNWYWGVDAGTSASRIAAPLFTWLLPGIQMAGPKLTPRTFQQGLFAMPPRGGAVDGQAYGTLFAWGEGPKLPYAAHAYSGLDFAPFWFDPDTSGPSNGVDLVGEGVNWFVDGGKRYIATTWPTKPIKWFEKEGAVFQFTSVPQLGYVGDCNDCPSHGGPGDPEAPSNTAIVFKAGGSGASAA
jgi:hypothetical protein